MQAPSPLTPQEHNAHPVYRPDIDGLRAIAILSVLIFHAFPAALPGGFIGVDIFFVISGFLISSIIYTSLLRGDFSFPEFYARRVKRIFPALILVLVACFIFGWFVLLPDELKQLGKHMAAGAGFVQNIVLWNESGYFATASELKPLMHLWSLAIEEQFYLIYPLLAWGLWRLGLNVLTAVLMLGLLSFGLNVDAIGQDAVKTFFLPQTRFWELLAGSVLAYVQLFKRVQFAEWLKRRLFLPAASRQPPSVRHGDAVMNNLLSAFGLFLIVAAAFALHKGKQFPGWWALAPVLGTCLLIFAGSNAWVNRNILAMRGMILIGLISYPLYLWHWPLLSFARILEAETPSQNIRIAVVALSVLLAWLTYLFLERPIRIGRKTWIKTAVPCALAVAAGVVGYKTFLSDGYPFRQVAKENLYPKTNIEYQSNPISTCDDDQALKELTGVCNKYLAANSKGSIFLWGDSSAGAWLPVFKVIAKENSLNLTIISIQSCLPVMGNAVTTFSIPEMKKYCSDGKTGAKVAQAIRVAKPSFVFLIGAWNYMSPYRTGNSGPNTLAQTFTELDQLSKLVVFKSWPILDADPNYGIVRLPFLRDTSQRTVKTHEKHLLESAFMEDIYAKAKTTNTSYFDPSLKICDDICRYVKNGVAVYHDGYHISPEGSMLYKEELTQLINSTKWPVVIESR